MNVDYNKKVRQLWKLWILSMAIAAILAIIYLNFIAGHIEGDPLGKFSIYHISLLLLIMLYSIPLLLRIQHYAHQSKQRASLIIAWGLIVHHSLWLLGTTVGG